MATYWVLDLPNIKVIPEFGIAHSYCARFFRHQQAHMSARVQNIRDFPQTKLDSEINAPFLLTEHGDPLFLSYKLNENNICNNRKNLAEIYGYFFGNWNKCYR